jgi:hypothetical protein
MSMTTMTAASASAHDGRPKLMARYGALPEARHAIEALEAHGVDGDDLALVGEGALVAEQQSRTDAADAQAVAYAARWITAGIVLGAVAGAAAGAVLVGAIVVLWPGGLSHEGWVFALVTAWLAAGGSLMGGFVAVARKTGFSDSWPLTFGEQPDVSVWLAVYRDIDPDRVGLSDTEPLEVRFDPPVLTRHPRERAMASAGSASEAHARP